MPEEKPVVFTRRASGLVREVGVFTALSLGLTHTIGGGINNYSVSAAFECPGGSVPLGFILGGIPVIITAIAYTMLSISMPRTGGDYIYISRAISPVLGFLTSWGFWFTEIVSLGVIAYIDVPFWGLGFGVYGTATGNATALSLATTLSENTTWILIIALIMVLAATVVTLLGTKVYSWIINIGLILGLAGSFVMVAFLIYRITGSPMELWDATYGAGTYQAIQNLAAETGWTPTAFSWDATMAITIPAAWAYIGFASASYIGGEVKNPSRSMIWAMIFGSALIVVYYAFITGAVYHVFGDFIPQYYHAWAYANEEMATIMPHYLPKPVLPLFACALMPGHMILQLVIAISAAIWLMNDIPAFFVVCSRIVFSWSFDRFFPERFANVNDRFHSPHWAITLTCVGGLAGVFFTWWHEYAAMVDTTMLFLFCVIFGCMAAAVTPFVRRDIYEKGGKFEIKGIPVMTITGVLGMFMNFALFMYAAKIVVDAGLSSVLQQSVWMGLGLLLFVCFYIYNIKRGVDVKTIYSEIPPA